MNKIVLYTATLDNGGQRHEAGTELAVGADDGEISTERAEQLLERSLCAEVSPPKAGKKVPADPAPAAAEGIPAA